MAPKKSKSKSKPVSLRAYARHRGVSAEAVSKAVKDGRLSESIVMVDGAPKVFDVDLADLEWRSNTRPRIDHGDDDEPSDESGIPNYNDSVALRAMHAARREGALADLAEIEVAERRDELVLVSEARKYMIDKFTVVKTKVLGVPTRLAQQMPELAERVVPIVDELLREVLEELAVDEDDGDDEEE